jgi:hypothetical protein
MSRTNKSPDGPLTAERLREVLNYDSDTGAFTWKQSKGNQFTKAGMRAGSVHHDGYRVARVDGKGYLEHRLAWLYINGAWPPGDLDHINRDRADSRIANLRESCDLLNGQNKSVASNNKSGARGVHWCKTYNKWRAVIRVNWKLKHIGRFNTVEEARAAYLEAAAIHHPFNSDLKDRNEQRV